MPAISKTTLLPKEVKEWLNDELEKRHYGSLTELTALLNEKGYSISRTVIGNYSLKRKKKLEAINAMRTWAVDIIGSIGKDGVNMSLANTAVLQQMIFELFSEMQDFSSIQELSVDKKMEMLIRLAKLQPELSRTFVTLDTYKTQLLAKLEKLESQGEGKKIDAETLKQVREVIFGL